MTFDQLPLLPSIQEALKKEGYTHPTPIQQESIPAILDRRDLLGCAQTGTGKTAAFAIPILQILHTEKRQGPRRIRALILTPTRELAIQIEEKLTAYGQHTGLHHAVIFGGVNQHSQVQKLKKGIDILVATPGRLLDLMNQKYVHLEHVEIFTLDEADRMLDMGFINDVKKVIAKLPQKKQSLFFSATMPPDIVELTKRILVQPVFVEVTPVSSTAETITQEWYYVEKKQKQQLLIHILKNRPPEAVLVFTRTKYGADKVARALQKAGITAAAIHGNKSQNARQNALKDFKSGRLEVLVATDIASRGIDIDELALVINYEIPNVAETYVHRIGRTGRAGASGVALSFCDVEEKEYMDTIHKLIKQDPNLNTEHPYHIEMPEKPAAPAQKDLVKKGGHFRKRYRGRKK